MKTRSALSYFGSDSEVAEQLAAFLNDCRHVSIPFCGGCAILPHLKARAIVCNDANDLVINFYRVASGLYGETARQHLFERTRKTLSHPSEIRWASAIIEGHRVLPSYDDTSRAEIAWAYWALCWLGRKGKGGTRHLGGDASVRRTACGGNNATRVRAAAEDLTSWANEFARCEFECRHFRDALGSCADRNDCGIYCDPPWVDLGRDYLHRFTNDDHVELRTCLDRFTNTRVLVRYGDHPLIRDLYRDWTIVEAESRTQSNTVKGELWIINTKGGES